MAAATMMAYPIRDGFQGYPQQYSVYQTRPQQSQIPVGQSITMNPYTHYTTVPQQQQPTQLSYHHHSTPRSSPPTAASPVSEDGFKPSLPSISNLLGIASRQTSTDSVTHHQFQVPSQQTQEAHSTQQAQTSPQLTSAGNVDSRSRGSYSTHELSTNPRSVVPPPPQSRNDSVLDSTQSPSAVSTGSHMSGPPYFVGSTLNNIDPADQRAIHSQMAKRHSVPSQPNVSPYENTRYTTSPYATSPSAGPAPAFFSPTEPNCQVPSGLYQQRPLPSNFPPPAPMPVQPTVGLPTANPWEHHHYISPSSQATYPQSQDRYICPTCSKAFSRPSSLKIHSHSHTGEKPFRCPHSGCGKAFSVRSNMKRHERGCHSGIPNAPPISHMQPHLSHHPQRHMI